MGTSIWKGGAAFSVADIREVLSVAHREHIKKTHYVIIVLAPMYLYMIFKETESAPCAAP